MAETPVHLGDQRKAADLKYSKYLQRKARTKQTTVAEYVAKTTTLFEGNVGENVSPSILALRRQSMEPRRPTIESGPPTGLPASDAEIEITVREPRGEFKLKITIQQVGEYLGAESRNHRGYLEAFNRGLVYALTGECR